MATTTKHPASEHHHQAALWQEVGAGCLIFVGAAELIVTLPGHQ